MGILIRILAKVFLANLVTIIKLFIDLFQLFYNEYFGPLIELIRGWF